MEIKPNVTEISKYEKGQKAKDEDDYSEYSDDETKSINATKRDKNPAKIDTKTFRKMSPKEKLHYVDDLMQKLCQGAPVSSKVSNMCMFKCPKCKDVFKGWNKIKRHFTQKHRGALKLSMLEVDHLLSNVVAHTCKLCSENVLCDSAFIRRHLVKHGNMDLLQYTMAFSANALKNIPKVKYSDDVIGSLCVYQCIDCGQKFECNRGIAKHKRKYFHMKNVEIFDSIIDKIFHKCKLCNKPVLCDETTLNKHFTRNHNSTTAEYCKRNHITHHNKRIRNENSLIESLQISKNIDNLCVFACPMCQEKHFTSHSIYRHLKQHNYKSLEPISSYLIKGFSYQCKNCCKLLLCDISTIHMHLRKNHSFTKEKIDTVTSYTSRLQYDEFYASYIRKTPESSVRWNKTVLPINKIPIQEINSRIGNLCTFSCPYCGSQSFPNWFTLRNHCNKVHKNGLAFDSSLVSVARCHACLLCPKAVLNDRFFIHRHLKSFHKRSLAEYERILQKNGGETLPTFRTWCKTYQNPRVISTA